MAAVQLPITLLHAQARPLDVVGLGQNSIDLMAHVSVFPGANSKQRLAGLDRMPGGQVASAMVCCARLGWRTGYVGTFGDDEGGVAGRASLTQEGIDVGGVVVVPGARSRTAIVIVEEGSGERTVLWDRDPRLTLRPSDVPVAAVTSGRVLLVDAEDVAASTEAAARARASGAITVVDVEAVAPGVEGLLGHIDMLIVSEGFPEAMTGASSTGEALARLASMFRPVVACVTLGADGCLARCAEVELHVPAWPIACVDSTGAGDAFRGGFIAGLLSGAGRTGVEHVLKYANAVAALNCRMRGARQGLPRGAEVDRLLGAPAPPG